MANLTEINNQIILWAKENLGENFEFREKQLETISQLIFDKIYNNICHHIIQAPTGSGKSLINIISAGVLWKYYNQKSYILCSDLYLYKQYVDFIDEYNLSDFAYLKGATGNYYCPKGKCDARNAPCKMAGISYGKLFSIQETNSDKDLLFSKYPYLLNFKCARNCEYLWERIEAINAPITLMTYHLFYFQFNICKDKFDSHGNPIAGQFLWRDQIFCDECHNIPTIMQSRCRATIKYEDLQKLIHIYNYYKSLKKNPQNIKLFKYCPDENEIKTLFSEYWTKMLDKKLESYDNTILLLNYTQKIVDKIVICAERIQNIFGTKVKKGLTLTDKQKEIYSLITWLQNYHCYLDDFSKAIKLTGYHHTYKQISKNVVNFGAVKEDGIIFYFLLRYGIKGTTLLSATVGDINSFKENCGYKFFSDEFSDYKIINTSNIEFINITNENVSFIDIPTNFNFEYSPIYLDFENKITYKTKDTDIIPISDKINKIIDYHYSENGIIQTGSYEIAQKIYKLINKENKSRILIYNNSTEKKQLLSKITKSTNYILIGPSLNEGIDLPKELCTFIIIAKVPFLSLADKYVTSKMKIFKKWYNNTAATNIIQGIGRGNRCKDDWCSIYILDGAFKRLYSYTKKIFPEFITDRFEYTNINKLLSENTNKTA